MQKGKIILMHQRFWRGFPKKLTSRVRQCFKTLLPGFSVKRSLLLCLVMSQHGIEVCFKRLQTWITPEIVRCADTLSRSFYLSRRQHRTRFVTKRPLDKRKALGSKLQRLGVPQQPTAGFPRSRVDSLRATSRLNSRTPSERVSIASFDGHKKK